MGDIVLMSREGANGDGKGDSRGKVAICEQLLPGILSEITLDHVAAKLPWTAFHMLSLVSSGWRQAIQSRQVYDARVRTQSTQTLVVSLVTNPVEDGDHVHTLALFSLTDGSSYDLPPIPGPSGGLNQGFLLSCQSCSLNGRLYVLGGFVCPPNNPSRDMYRASNKAYVLDLVGKKQWKQCASMAKPRGNFVCGVINGKIYVFGGANNFDSINHVYGVAEVYDPKVDAWSPIAPLEILLLHPQVVAIGEELFVHNQYVARSMLPLDPKTSPLQVYNPIKNQWRSMVMDDGIKRQDILLAVGGKLHKINENGNGIDIYDTRANAWNPLHSFAFGDLRPRDSLNNARIMAALADDDELLCEARLDPHQRWTTFLRSQGFGGQNKEITWKELQCSPSFHKQKCALLCLIQL